MSVHPNFRQNLRSVQLLNGFLLNMVLVSFTKIWRQFKLWLNSDNTKGHFTQGLHAFLCVVVTGWGIPKLPCSPLLLWLSKLSCFLGNPQPAVQPHGGIFRDYVATKRDTRPLTGHWLQTSLTSLAPLAKIEVQIPTKAPYFSRYVYIS